MREHADIKRIFAAAASESRPVIIQNENTSIDELLIRNNNSS
jgi:hypothetical protein